MNRLLVSLLVLLSLAALAHADTTWVADSSASGTWTSAHSPYMIQRSVSVRASDTLSIGPGVTVYFTGPYRLNVLGLLLALGTVSDSIRFTTDTLANTARWRGLRFLSARDSCRMEYCLIEYGYGTTPGDDRFGGGIECQTCRPTFSHCTVRYCTALLDGGGVYCRDSSAPRLFDCEISHCLSRQGEGGGLFSRLAGVQLTRCQIRNNQATLAGGGVGIIASYSNSTLTDCIIEGNIAEDGGGVFIRNHRYSILFDRCTIRGNAALRGGGILDSAATVQYVNCLFSTNFADSGGAIFSADTSHLRLNFCTLARNRSAGGTVCSRGDSLTVNNSIVAFTDLGAGILFQHPRSAQVAYCDFFGDSSGAFSGDVPANVGRLTRVNRRQDSCDYYLNIFVNPLFADTTAQDYHLTALSHCIDAGDATQPRDPDSTLADMGAFYFPQPGHPPLPFTLIAPANDSTVAATGPVPFVWHRSIDPDYWDAPNYVLQMTSPDTVLSFSAGADSSLSINVSALHFANHTYWIQWWVDAHSHHPDTTVSSDTFRFWPDIPNAISDHFILHPSSFSLFCYPNPFNPTAQIRYDLPKSGWVTLKVFDLLGREVTTLVDRKVSAGSYSIEWSAAALPSGMYFAVLQAGNNQIIQKLLLLK